MKKAAAERPLFGDIEVRLFHEDFSNLVAGFNDVEAGGNSDAAFGAVNNNLTGCVVNSGVVSAVNVDCTNAGDDCGCCLFNAFNCRHNHKFDGVHLDSAFVENEEAFNSVGSREVGRISNTIVGVAVVESESGFAFLCSCI